VAYCDHQVVIFPLLWFCAYLSSVEVVVLWVCGYPSCVEVIVFVVWLSALSLLCRGDCYSALCPSLLCRVIEFWLCALPLE